MAGTGKKWLIGCGVGCGVAIMLNIFLFVGAGILFTRPMDKAVKSQKILTENFGEPGDYIPEAGSLSPDRIEIFLAIRKELMPSCLEFEKATAGFQAMEEIGESEEEPSAGEIFKGLGKVMGSVKGLVMEMGQVVELRNQALVEKNMSMGEYTWIYVLAYYSMLDHIPNTGVDSDGGSFSSREQDVIEDLMANHAQALATAGRSEEADLWRAELKKLNWDDDVIPFSGRPLPEEILVDLEPYRAQLEASYCVAMSEFDLGMIKKSGLSFHSD